MNTRSRIISIVTLIAVVAGILTVFYRVSNRQGGNEDMAALSTTQSVVQRDLAINYPPTPKAVVRYYAELSQCMYDPENTEKDIVDLAVQSRKLFDAELVSNQSDEEYLHALTSTIDSFEKDKRRIVSFTTSSSSDVQYSTNEVGECAALYCVYTMQKDGTNYTDTERFLLRKDGNSHWKILGWQPA